MKNICQRDKKKRKKIQVSENINLIYKSISKNFNFKNSIRLNSNLRLTSLSTSYNSRINVTNRCIMSGRKSKIAKNLKFSRICLLNIVREGLLSGIRKSSW